MNENRNKLLLASGSATRKQLLEEIGIQVRVVPHAADEKASCDWALPLVQLVESLACAKMESVCSDSLDQAQDTAFILTADSLCQDLHGFTFGKPRDQADAIGMIKALRNGGRVATAFCLEKRKKEKDSWKAIEQITQVVTTSFILAISDEWLEVYLDHVPEYMSIGGALDVQNFGGQFLKTVDGSYTALIGLPLYELRLALEKIGFFTEKQL